MKVQMSFYWTHIVFFLLYSLCNVILWCFSPHSGLFLMLIWNAFLSFLPLLFSRLAVWYRSRMKTLWILWAFLWIVFWPNTFYMVTDVIHLSGDAFSRMVSGISNSESQQIVYSTDILLWSKAVVIVSGILYGVINGINSEMLLEKRMLRHTGTYRYLPILFRILCSILGGAVIYIGRFLRFNSWDIFRPAKILNAFRFSGHSTAFVVEFIGIFSAFILCVLCFAPHFLRENHLSEE